MCVKCIAGSALAVAGLYYTRELVSNGDPVSLIKPFAIIFGAGVLADMIMEVKMRYGY